MSRIESAWGAGPSSRYEQLIAPFRPIFERIRVRAVARELNHELLFPEIAWLRDAGFPRLRLPVDYGGAGATLPELFAALTELGAADPNVVNALRSHFGFCEEVLGSTTWVWRETWLERLGKGAVSGSGFSETGEGPLGSLSTRLTKQDGALRLDGEKYYTSGSLYADWINLSASNEANEAVGILVPTNAEGVEIVDDWDGFGQQLSASGTARFRGVRIEPEWIKPTTGRFRYAAGFFQLVHLASLAGIGQTASEEVAEAVAKRTRIYGGRTNVSRVSEDPQILEVVGTVRGAAYVCGAVVLKAAEALQRAADAQHNGDEVAQTRAFVLADVEVSQSVRVVTDLILSATTEIFDALGSSAAKRGQGLDRHWRNARTISSHNPRVYHNRIVGDYAVNGNAPAPKTGIGTAPAKVLS
ncbi:acyl-CoA dehydrogenase family protein [Paraburkholderia sp. EG285A]|uniref:acyl-CoA dehydrogenase family protein n=1 Tax=Paraburkholderia sp. EG285A TaxID=3237009 RepID=UPI0034D35779